MADKEKKSAQDAVKKWLIESGYPLEMKAAATLRRHGFSVWQAETYVDPETNELREIDAVAIEYAMIDSHGIEFSVYVECKRSFGKPWVIFLDHKQRVMLFESMVCDVATRGLLRYAAKDLEGQKLALFETRGEGYGMTQSLRSKDGHDESYRASMQVTKAVERRLLRSNSQFEEKLFDKSLTDSVLVVPVVVIDTQLYTAHLDKEELVLGEVERHVVLVKHSEGLGAMSTYVVTSSGLEAFVQDLRKGCDAWIEWLRTNADRIDGISAKEVEGWRARRAMGLSG